jgi:tetratricopeptide (TPR) repeat protein
LDYSFSKLSEKARRHLPFLGLFSERVYEYWLSHFVGQPGSEVEHAYRNVFGDNVKASDWQQILDDATEVGILEYLGSKVYKVHPALPWYLRQKLNITANAVKIQELEKYLLMFYAGLAENYANEIICNPESTSLMLRIEEPNFLYMLYLAEKKQDWNIVRLILSILGEVYKRWGRKQEFNSLRQKILKKIGTKLKYVKEKGDAAFDLWMYLQNNIANEASATHDYEKAKLIYQEILNELISLNTPSVNDGIATLNNNLAGIAIKQRDINTAITHLKTALHIRESSGDLHRAAAVYLNMSELAKIQRQFSEAIDYSQKALKIYEDIHDLYKVGDAYSKLAEIAREQRQYEQAISHSKEAVKIYEHFGDFYQAASVYHEIGNIKHLQGQDEESTKYYHKSLKIYEDAKDWCNAADEYLQLGNVATTQHKLDDAIAYYQKALSIFEETENRDNLATVYHQLGLMLHQHQLFEHAIIYCQKSWFFSTCHAKLISKMPV